MFSMLKMVSMLCILVTCFRCWRWSVCCVF